MTEPTLREAIAVIESFAPERPTVTGDKPYRIGVRKVPIYVIPVSFVDNVQLIEVRVV